MFGDRDQALQERRAGRLLEGRCVVSIAWPGVAAAPFVHTAKVEANKITPR
jgi:hypothetical protein